MRASLVLPIVLCTLAYGAEGLAAPVFGHAPPPQCVGNERATAEKELAGGKALYRRAKASVPPDPSALTAALAAFEASCAAGDDMALEFRAYALAGLGRWVEAAESLDVFLSIHPLDSLDAAVRERVMGQQEEILKRVTSLTVKANPKAARVWVNHRDMGLTPLIELRLEPGTYDIEVQPEGGAPETRTLTFGVGSHTEEFDLQTDRDVQPAMPSPRPEGFTWTTQRIAGVAVGAGGLALGAGIGLAFVASGLSINAQIPNDCPSGVDASGKCTVPAEQTKRTNDRSQVSLDWTVTGIAFGVGVGAAIVGATLFLLAPSKAAKSKAQPLMQVVPLVGPLFAGLSLVASY